ncbi:MAG: hypothetical protein ACK5NC_15210 [Vibrio sp.]
MFTYTTALAQQFVTATSTHELMASNEDTYSASSPLFARLAFLSKRPQWVLFTSGAILPTEQELHAFGIASHKVVKIRPSQLSSEKDIILKVLDAHNASAIVASDNFSNKEKAELTLQAKQNDCEIFFMDKKIQQTLTRHLH